MEAKLIYIFIYHLPKCLVCLLLCQLFTLTRIVWKTGSRGRYFGENEKFLMVKSENEVRVFLLADFLTDGAEEMILVKEVAWRGLCSFKNKEKWKEKEYREKTEERKIKHCNSKSYFTQISGHFILCLIHQATWSAL